MPTQMKEREIQVSGDSTFSVTFVDKLADIIAEQDSLCLQCVRASTEGARVERAVVDWGAVLSAAREAVITAAAHPDDNEFEDIPADEDLISVREVDVSADGGTITLGVVE